MRLMNEITEPIRPIPQRRVIEKMNEMGLLGDLPESNQISLFDMTW